MNDYKTVEKIIDLTSKGKIEWSSEYEYGEGYYWHGKYKGVDIELWESWLCRKNRKKNLWVNGIVVSIDKEQRELLSKIVERQISLIQSKEQAGKEREIFDILEVK